MKTRIAILYAVLAAAFYAINMPCSKLLLAHIPSTLLAGLLYLGAGVGVGGMFLLQTGKIERRELLAKRDIPYVIGMVVLDILAPIFLLYGLQHTTAANASLLNNFEIVATTLIALLLFRESVSKLLWLAILFVTLSSGLLSFEDVSSLQFSWGSLWQHRTKPALRLGTESTCIFSVILHRNSLLGVCLPLANYAVSLAKQMSAQRRHFYTI